MTEKNEKLKPPARPKGRVLGGANKKMTPPPPPPAAELTPEQFAAERAADQSEGHRPAVGEQDQSTPAPTAWDGLAQDLTETAPGVPQASTTVAAQTSAQDARSSPAPEPFSTQPTGAAVVTPEVLLKSAVEPRERQVQAQTAVPVADPTVQPKPSGPSQSISEAPGMAHAAEVAIRPAVLPAAGTAFRVKTEFPGSRQQQEVRSEAAPSQEPPWAQGPGRPTDIPEVAVILNQRIIARESLDSSVPAALKLKKRIKRFALDNELELPPRCGVC
ncbi:hypothetical protein [Streptomyces phaeochromogenes]|uniref:hypothetical protein n=1 Tax=Streptomyces phaeochromogenes TaxID=1923 RepID=UPI00386E422A|nr:hypothetical protein OG277_35080 [Streptomyces phaeochromogenes]